MSCVPECILPSFLVLDSEVVVGCVIESLAGLRASQVSEEMKRGRAQFFFPIALDKTRPVFMYDRCVPVHLLLVCGMKIG